jgi:hypothetical protein
VKEKTEDEDGGRGHTVPLTHYTTGVLHESMYGCPSWKPVGYLVTIFFHLMKYVGYLVTKFLLGVRNPLQILGHLSI